MAVRIRSIEEDDIATAVLVITGGSLAPQCESTQRLGDYWSAVQRTRSQGGDVLVADEDGEVVGVCQVILFQHFQHAGGWCCELESVHVRDDRRSHGIGAMMLEAAEMLARERGCYRIQLTSRNVRVDAHRFYVANGYEATSVGFKKFFN